MEQLEAFDQWLFLVLNGWNHSWIDPIMSALSNKFIWIPFYAFLLYRTYRHFSVARLFMIKLGCILMTVGLTDRISVMAFKNVFLRYRPCHNLELQSMVHLVNEHCGGMYGFVSSHAANTFGIATIVILLIGKCEKWVMPWMLIWATCVSYSRIYLGVHYPSDILGGALLGVCVALFTFRLQKMTLNFIQHA